MTRKSGERYKKRKLIDEELIAGSNDFSGSISLYKIHLLGVLKYIIFTLKVFFNLPRNPYLS